jgi:predicted NAD/FAD-dependent oxidoreductase
MASGLVGSWNPRIAPGTSLPEFAGEKWTIGIPTMSAVARKLADGIEVKTECRVESITCKQGRWSLLESDKKRRIEADLVVMAIPAPQAACLLAHTEFAHLRKIKSVSYDPIWSLLLEGDEIPELSYDMYGSDTEPLQWLVSQSSRQGRSKLPAWVGLASRSWSGEHLEDDPLVVRDVLMNSVNRMTGENWACPGSVHRWRYGLVEHALGEPSLSDTDLGIFACGDWCLGPSVEHAIRSGHHVANQIALAVAS